MVLSLCTCRSQRKKNLKITFTQVSNDFSFVKKFKNIFQASTDSSPYQKKTFTFLKRMFKDDICKHFPSTYPESEHTRNQEYEYRSILENRRISWIEVLHHIELQQDEAGLRTGGETALLA